MKHIINVLVFKGDLKDIANAKDVFEGNIRYSKGNLVTLFTSILQDTHPDSTYYKFIQQRMTNLASK